MTQRISSELEVVWEAPPAQSGPSAYDEVLARVKRSPGRWARIRLIPLDGPPSAHYNEASRLRRRYKDTPEWEFRAAQTEEGKGVFARYRTAEQMKAVK